VPFANAELTDPPPSLHAFLEERFRVDPEVPGDEDTVTSASDPIDSLEDGLSATLESGRFVLVVAAPEIPPGVRRAIDYLNAQGMRMFGVEMGYPLSPRRSSSLAS
jgi:hypothetical protein